MKSKKAVSLWISWVLLLGLVFMIASVVLVWSEGFVEDNVDSTRRQVENTNLCEKISLDIEEIFEKNPKTLYIKATNSHNIRVETIKIQYFDGSNVVGSSVNEDIVIEPGETRGIEVEMPDAEVGTVEIIPGKYSTENKILCEDKRLKFNIKR